MLTVCVLIVAGSCPNYLRYLDHTVFKVVRRIFFREKISFVFNFMPLSLFMQSYKIGQSVGWVRT